MGMDVVACDDEGGHLGGRKSFIDTAVLDGF